MATSPVDDDAPVTSLSWIHKCVVGCRYDPQDWLPYTLEAIERKYANALSKEEVAIYWNSRCVIAAGFTQRGNDERRIDPNDGEAYSWQELWERHRSRLSMAAVQNLWDTKCLVVQPEEDMLEERVDPDDGERCTFAAYRKKYKGSYSLMQIERYWQQCCKPVFELQDTDVKLVEASADISDHRVNASPYRFGFPEHTIEIVYDAGKVGEMTYVTFLPCNVHERHDWPLLVWIAGNGESHNEEWMKEMVSLVERNKFAREHFVIVVPIIFNSEVLVTYREHKVVNEEALWYLIQQAAANMSDIVDVTRICVTGFSLGADASLRLALRYGRALAAIAPIAASYDSVLDLFSALDAEEHIAKLPIRAFHSIADTYVPVCGASEFFKVMSTNLEFDTSLRYKVFVKSPPPQQDQIDHNEKIILNGQCSKNINEFKHTYTGQEIVPVDITCYRGRGEGKELWLFPGKGHGFARHTIWSAIYRGEEEFGLWKWMLAQRNPSARLMRNFSCIVELPLLPKCCENGNCRVQSHGISFGILGGRIGVSANPEPVLGRLGHWNVRQLLEGRSEQLVRAGDRISSIDDCSGIHLLPRLETLSPRSGISKLEIKRDACIESDASFRDADMGKITSTKCDAFLQVFLRGVNGLELINTGVFNKMSQQSKSACIDRFLSCKWLSQQLCPSYIHKLCSARREEIVLGADFGFLGRKLPWDLRGLLWDADYHIRQGHMKKASLALGVASRSIFRSYLFIAALELQAVRSLILEYVVSFRVAHLCFQANALLRGEVDYWGVTRELKHQRRVDPHDGVTYTLMDLLAKYAVAFSREQIVGYWNIVCQEDVEDQQEQ